MTHRKLTEGCLYALRALCEAGDDRPLDIYNPIVASNLRVVERVYPEFIRIVPPPACSHDGARPRFGAIITARGRAYVTPRKLREVRP